MFQDGDGELGEGKQMGRGQTGELSCKTKKAKSSPLDLVPSQ